MTWLLAVPTGLFALLLVIVLIEDAVYTRRRRRLRRDEALQWLSGESRW